MKKSVLILFSVTFTLINFSITIAQPGSLDEIFGGDGKITTSIGNYHDIARAIAIQEDGKLVVGGYMSNYPGFDFALVRYNPDGTLDNSFDMDGKVTIDFNNSSDNAEAIVIQPDGKILIAGSSSISAFSFALAR